MMSIYNGNRARAGERRNREEMMQKKFDPKVFQLGHVALATPDIQRTKDHYLQNLGMTEVARGDDGAERTRILRGGCGKEPVPMRPRAVPPAWPAASTSRTNTRRRFHASLSVR
jgi:Glyoxalase/Bleomycin resistance protein/Dioxygenase superfamily